MVTLCPAQPTDAGATGAILWQSLQDVAWMECLHSRAETIDFCGRMIDDGWVTVAVAGKKDIVVGFIAREGEHIHALYLARRANRQGIGRMLLEDAKSRSKRLALWTFQANTGGCRFYRREGFVEVGRSDGAGNDEKLPDISFVWPKEAAT